MAHRDIKREAFLKLKPSQGAGKDLGTPVTHSQHDGMLWGWKALTLDTLACVRITEGLVKAQVAGLHPLSFL